MRLRQDRGFVGFGKGCFERRFDVAIGNAARAQFARDAEASLLAATRA